MIGLSVVPRVLIAPVRSVVRTVSLVPRALEAVLVLPALAEQLQRVNENTEALPDMLAQLHAVRGDTTSLPLVHEELAAMRLIVGQVEQNTLAVEQLAEIAVPLQGAALRMGRLADRLPQRRFAPNGHRGESPAQPD